MWTTTTKLLVITRYSNLRVEENIHLKQIMKFRPCIDLHEGVVKQIVGSSLSDDSLPSDRHSQQLLENFVSKAPASYFAEWEKSYYSRLANTFVNFIYLSENIGKKIFEEVILSCLEKTVRMLQYLHCKHILMACKLEVYFVSLCNHWILMAI